MHTSSEVFKFLKLRSYTTLCLPAFQYVCLLANSLTTRTDLQLYYQNQQTLFSSMIKFILVCLNLCFFFSWHFLLVNFLRHILPPFSVTSCDYSCFIHHMYYQCSKSHDLDLLSMCMESGTLVEWILFM